MKEAIGLSEELAPKIRLEKGDGQKNISFSQYSVYESCPYRWYLTYGKGIYLFSASINTVFGTAIHEALQTYLTIMFKESVKKAEEFDKKQEEKLVPTVDQSTIKGNQPTANSRVLKSEKTQEELIKIYKENNKAIKESNKETKLMNQKFELLINTLDSKDFSTQIYNNTTNNTTSTPSFGSGNSIRR